MFKKIIFFFISVFYLCQQVSAYSHQTDSLLNELKKPYTDSARVIILLDIVEQGMLRQDSLLLLITDALKTAERNKSPQLISKSYHYLSHWHIGHTKNQDTILYHCRIHLERMQQLKYIPGIAGAYGNLGMAYTWHSLDSSMFYNWKSVDHYKEVKDFNRANNARINLANVYMEMKRYSEAIGIFNETADYGSKIGNNHAASLSYFNMSECYTRLGDLTNAEKCIIKGCTFNDTTSYSMSYCNAMLADVYVAEGKLTEAQNLYQDILKTGKENNLAYILYRGNFGMAEVSFKNRKWEDAIRYKKLSWEYSYKDLDSKQSLYKMIYACDRALGNYKLSLTSYQAYIAVRDSFENVERLNNADALEAKYQNKEKQSQIELLDTEKQLQQTETDKQKSMRNSIALVLALVIVTGVYAFSRYRVRVKQKQEAERARISRDLHDDVGATLGSISIYSEVAKNKSTSANGSDMNEVLEKIGDSSREMLEKMNDIVWAVNPKNDTAEELIHRMKNFAALMLTPRQIQFSFNSDASGINGFKLEMQQRKNIFLIYKEALHNIIKYADAKTVKVNMNINGKNLMFEIYDDGKGFNHENKFAYNGNGIKNMQQRIDEIGGNFKIYSEVNKGTCITIRLPA